MPTVRWHFVRPGSRRFACPGRHGTVAGTRRRSFGRSPFGNVRLPEIDCDNALSQRRRFHRLGSGPRPSPETRFPLRWFASPLTGAGCATAPGARQKMTGSRSRHALITNLGLTPYSVQHKSRGARRHGGTAFSSGPAGIFCLPGDACLVPQDAPPAPVRFTRFDLLGSIFS
jgi:hypothetical protein